MAAIWPENCQKVFFRFSGRFWAPCNLAKRFEAQKQVNLELAYPDIFKDFITPCINGLYSDMNKSFATLALRLHLQAALAADNILKENGATTTYDFFSHALMIYEDVLPDTKEQAAVIPSIVGTIEKINHLDLESLDPLRTQTAQLAGRLFRKPDQVQATLTTTHCFYNKKFGQKFEFYDHKRIITLLEKSSRVCYQIQNSRLKMENLLDILNKSLYFQKLWKLDILNFEKIELGDNIGEAEFKKYQNTVETCYKSLEEIVLKLRTKIEDIKRDGMIDSSYELTENCSNMLDYCGEILKQIEALDSKA